MLMNFYLKQNIVKLQIQTLNPLTIFLMISLKVPPFIYSAMKLSLLSL